MRQPSQEASREGSREGLKVALQLPAALMALVVAGGTLPSAKAREKARAGEIDIAPTEQNMSEGLVGSIGHKYFKHV